MLIRSALLEIKNHAAVSWQRSPSNADGRDLAPAPAYLHPRSPSPPPSPSSPPAPDQDGNEIATRLTTGVDPHGMLRGVQSRLLSERSQGPLPVLSQEEGHEALAAAEF